MLLNLYERWLEWKIRAINRHIYQLHRFRSDIHFSEQHFQKRRAQLNYELQRVYDCKNKREKSRKLSGKAS